MSQQVQKPERALWLEGSEQGEVGGPQRIAAAISHEMLEATIRDVYFIILSSLDP